MKKTVWLTMLFTLFAIGVASSAYSAQGNAVWDLDEDKDGLLYDGVSQFQDPCPHIHDPSGGDNDGNGVCDMDEVAFVEDEKVRDLRATTVTPYGAWFQFTVPVTESTSYYNYILVYSKNKSDFGDSSSFSDLIDNGNYIDTNRLWDSGRPSRPLRSTVITGKPDEFFVIDLEPRTKYYAAMTKQSWQGINKNIDIVSNVIEFTTESHPVVTYQASHPKTLYNNSDIERLRALYNSGDQNFLNLISNMEVRIYNDGILKGGISKAGNNIYLLNAILLYEVTGNPQLLDYAKVMYGRWLSIIQAESSIVARRNEYRWFGNYAIYALDLMWNHLTQSEREVYMTALLDVTESSVLGYPLMKYQDTDETAAYLRNYILIDLVAGQDFNHTADNARIVRLRDLTRRFFWGHLAVKTRKSHGKFAMSGGTSDDGVRYGLHTIGFFVEAFNALKNSGNHLPEFDQYVKNIMYGSLIHYSSPDMSDFYAMLSIEQPYANSTTGGYPYNAGGDPREEHLALLLLHFFETSDVERGYARYFLDEHSRPSYTGAKESAHLYLLNYFDSNPVNYYGKVPLTYEDKGMGLFFSRDKWHKQDASMLVTHNGSGGIDHIQNDDGSFAFNRKNSWLITENSGYGGIFPRMAKAHPKVVLEGRGRYNNNQSHIVGAYSVNGKYRNTYSESNRGYDFVKMDLTGKTGHPDGKYYNYEAVYRNLVWIKSDGSKDMVVIQDIVNTMPAYVDLDKYVNFVFDHRQSTHFDGKILNHVRDGQELFLISHFNKDLTYDDQTLSASFGGTTPDYTYNLEIRSKNAAAYEDFITTLIMADANSLNVDDRYTSQIVGTGNGGAANAKGVNIDNAYVVIFSDNASSESVIKYQTTTSADTMHVVAGLIKNADYRVFVDGALLETVKSTKVGTLKFSSNSAGAHTFEVKTDGGSDEVTFDVNSDAPVDQFSARVPEGQTERVVFSCSAENETRINSISLFINGRESGKQNVQGTQATARFGRSLGVGNYNWYCGACDGEMCVESEPRNLKIMRDDGDPPPPPQGLRIEASAPANNYAADGPERIVFSCGAENETNVNSIGLFINGNERGNRKVRGTSPTAKFGRFLGVGNYSWSCRACDNDSCVDSDERKLKVLPEGEEPPGEPSEIEVTSNSPVNNFSADGPERIVFSCGAQNDTNLKSVSLFINGYERGAKNVRGTRATAKFGRLLGVGNYDWSCRACDSESCADSEQRRLRIE